MTRALAIALTLILLMTLTASNATARSRVTRQDKIRTFEQLDRMDGYNDNCIVVDGWAYCAGDPTRDPNHCESNPNDCP